MVDGHVTSSQKIQAGTGHLEQKTAYIHLATRFYVSSFLHLYIVIKLALFGHPYGPRTPDLSSIHARTVSKFSPIAHVIVNERKSILLQLPFDKFATIVIVCLEILRL